jgi:hypothetical protein
MTKHTGTLTRKQLHDRAIRSAATRRSNDERRANTATRTAGATQTESIATLAASLSTLTATVSNLASVVNQNAKSADLKIDDAVSVNGSLSPNGGVSGWDKVAFTPPNPADVADQIVRIMGGSQNSDVVRIAMSAFVSVTAIAGQSGDSSIDTEGVDVNVTKTASLDELTDLEQLAHGEDA